MKHITSIIILFLLSISFSYSQKAYTPKFADPLKEQYRWRHFREFNGKNFTSFCEGENGTIWFGIAEGVMSYDGYEWKEYPIPFNEQEIADIRAMVYYEDTLFVFGSGLLTLVDGKWNRLMHNVPIEMRFKDMQTKGKFSFRQAIVSNDAIIAAFSFGIYIRRNGKEHFYTNEIIKQRNDTILTDLKIHAIDNFGDGVRFICSNILDGKNNTYYAFSTSVEGENVKKHFKFKLTGNDENPLEVIKNDIETDIELGGPCASIVRKNGEIWLVSESYNFGLNILRNNEWRLVSFKDLVQESEVSWHILNLDDGSVLVTSFGAVYRYYNGQWSKIIAPDIPFKTTHLNALYTKSGDLWLGDERGSVYKIDYSSKHYKTYDKLNYQITDSDGTLWFISDDEKVVYEKDNKWFYYDQRDGLLAAPQALFRASNGVLWCGGSHNNSSATAYLKNNKWIKQIQPAICWSIGYTAIAEANDSSVWFASTINPKKGEGQGGGVIKNVLVDNKLISTPIIVRRPNFNNLIPHKKGFYASSNYGYYYFNESDLIAMHKQYRKNRVSDNNNIIYNRIIQTKSGNIWAGSIGPGVEIFSDSTLKKRFTSKDGLASNVVYDLYASSDSSVWAATDLGFSYYNGKAWNNDIYPSEFNIGIESGKITGKKNQLWISKFPIKWTRRVYNLRNEIGGFKNFYSIRYSKDSMPPETHISFHNKKVDASGNTNIEWYGTDFMNHTSIDKLIYSYRLNGKDWSVPTRKKSVNLLSLKAGEYVFEVRAYDTDMNYDSSPASVTFIVTPPVWKQPWFIFMVFSFIAIISLMATRIIIRNKKLANANQKIKDANVEIKTQNENINTKNIELEKANSTKDKFFSIISHDLKSPFNSMMGFSNMLSDNFDNLDIDKQKSFIKQIDTTLESTYNLLENLLTWSRSQTGVIEFIPEKLNLKLLVDNTLRIIENAATLKAQTLESKIPENILAYADENMLKTIIRNLLSNAIKFTPRDGLIIINAEIRRDTRNKKIIEVSVKDNGIGIDPKQIPDIFKIKISATTKGTEDEGGTGLGLILCKEFVEKHGGKIWVESIFHNTSEKATGSTFFFTIPCA